MFVRIVLLLLPLIALGAEFRKDGGMLKKKVDSMAVTYPATPTYAVGTLYTASGCASTATGGGYSVLLNTCMSGSSTSTMYTCSGTTLTATSYGNTNCAGTGATVGSYSTCDAISVPIGSSGYSMSMYVAINSCSATTSTATNGGANVFSGEYADTACSKPVWTYGLVNNQCYTSGGVSAKLTWPTGTVYSDTTCTTVFDSGTVQSACMANGATGSPSTDSLNSMTSSTVSFAPQNVHLGMGVLMSVLMVFFQLFKN